MAHEIIFDDLRGIQPIAFTGPTPWHGLGQQLAPNSPLEVWAQQAGMDWNIESSAITFHAPKPGARRTNFNFPNRKVLYRNDNSAPLSIVGANYNVVQPGEVLEFFRDLTEAGGFRLNTAGVLFGGTKFWALAETGMGTRIMGQDKIDSYLLLATSCDGSLATTAMFTSVRVVCNNTLGFAVQAGEAGQARQYLKIPHSRHFDPAEVKGELGLAEKSFEVFVDSANRLAKRRVKDREAMEWLLRVFGSVGEDEEITPEMLDLPQAKNVKSCLQLFKGAGLGSHLKSSEGTAFGLLNSVTEWADHRRKTRTVDSRLNNAWFGDMALLKQKAWNEALKLAA